MTPADPRSRATHPRGVQTVLDEVEREVSEYDVWPHGTGALPGTVRVPVVASPPLSFPPLPPPRKDVFQGVAEITDALRACGLGTWSERSVRRMLAKRQVPAAKVCGQWVTTRSLLEGLADTWVRAQVAGMCLCRWCPQHGRL